VAGIAAISLVVAGVLVMNVMLVSVSQRTAEIGLLKAMGATHADILGLFLSEAAVLSAAGAVSGSALGALGMGLLQQLYPQFPIQLPLWAAGFAMAVALVTGLLFGVMPARKAARLNPISALARH
jgi:putative ABC transport system permease protein